MGDALMLPQPPAADQWETVNGDADWETIATPTHSAGDSGNGLLDFLGGAASTTPFNPMNIGRALAHPLDTIGGMVKEPANNLRKFGGDVSEMVTGNDPEHPIRDRGIALVQALKHLGGSVPFIGPAAIEAGNDIGEGHIAKGAGELTGIASSALVPKVPGAAGRATSAVGRAAETVGSKLNTGYRGVGAPAAAALNLFYHPSLAGAATSTAIAATPYALEIGGRAAQRVGGALEGLGRRITGEPTPPPTEGEFGGSPNARGGTTPVPPDPNAPTPPHLDMSTPIRASELTNEQFKERSAAAKAEGYEAEPRGGPKTPRPSETTRRRAEAAANGIGESAPPEMNFARVNGEDVPVESATEPIPDSTVEPQTEMPESAPVQTEPPPSIRIMQRHDERWGPGSTDKTGQPAQASPTVADVAGTNPHTASDPEFANAFQNKAHLGYDPQTPTPYLIEQLRTATDPVIRQRLLDWLKQRQRLDRLPQ